MRKTVFNVRLVSSRQPTRLTEHSSCDLGDGRILIHNGEVFKTGRVEDGVELSYSGKKLRLAHALVREL